MSARGARGRPIVAMFSTPWDSKFQRMRPLISDLVRHGLEVHMFTDQRFAAQVEQAGATFVDLFGAYPVEAVDDESIPFPCRHVTFAASQSGSPASFSDARPPGRDDRRTRSQPR